MNKDLLKFLIELREDIRSQQISDSIEDNQFFEPTFILEKITKRINEELED